MRSSSFLRSTVLGVALSLAFAAAASAQIVVGQQIGVDINSHNIGEDTTSAGTVANWTPVDAFTSGIQALDVSNGSSIGGVTIAFATSGNGATGGFNLLGGSAANNRISPALSPITTDGAYGTSTSGANTLTLTFSGLNPSLTYRLVVFSISNNIFADNDVPSINGNATSWPSGFASRSDRFSQTTGATFSGLTTDGSGNLSFGITDFDTSNAIMNGAILTATASAVPEPSTYAALLGAAALGAAIYRRRQTHQSQSSSAQSA